MRKVLDFKRLEDGFYSLEYQREFLFFKRKYKTKVFRGVMYWRDLYTGYALPYDLDGTLDMYARLEKMK